VPLQTALDLPAFRGPLDLLLSLIERRRLEITEISLATVADQYLQAVRALPRQDPDLLAEFLVIGARLLLLKSRALLPQPPALEEEEPVDDLAERLEAYRRVKEVALLLGARLESGGQAFTHPARPGQRDYQPPLAPIEAETLARLWSAISQRQRPAPAGEPALPPRVEVAERLRLLRALIAQRGRLSWEEVAGETRDELIATFLAVLELVRRSELTVSQEQCFGAIVLTARSPSSLPSDRAPSRGS
jgi:segregation and condensation protein A